MKRSEMLEQIRMTLSGQFREADWANQILTTVEVLGMLPPPWMKPLPIESDGYQYPLVPGDFKDDNGIWCTPGYHGWEPENEM